MSKRDLDMATSSRTSELDMVNYNREISEMIKSGEYFRDAQRWYDEKYHAPIIDKAYSLVVTLVAVLSTWFAFQGFTGFLPVAEPVTLVLKVKDSERKDYSMQMLSERTQYTNYVLLRYMLTDYLTRREGYYVGTLEADVMRVRSQSTQESFASYRQSLDPSNPQSPITRYERHTRRLVEVEELRFPGVEDVDAEITIPAKAEILFSARTVNARGEQVSRWKAEIGFTYVPVQVEQENFTVKPMEFKVSSYKVEPLSGAGK